MNFDPTQTGDSVAEAHEKVVLSNAADFAMGGLRRAGNFFRPRRLVDAAQTVGAAAIAGALFATKVLGEAMAAVSAHADTEYSDQQANESERTIGPLGEKQKAFIKQWLPGYNSVEDLKVEHAKALSEKIVELIGDDPEGSRRKLLEDFFASEYLGDDSHIELELSKIAKLLNSVKMSKRKAMVNEILGIDPKKLTGEEAENFNLENVLVKASWNDAEKQSLYRLLKINVESDDAEKGPYKETRLALDKLNIAVIAVKEGYAENAKFKEWYESLVAVIEIYESGEEDGDERLLGLLTKIKAGNFIEAVDVNADQNNTSKSTLVERLILVRDRLKPRYDSTASAPKDFKELKLLLDLTIGRQNESVEELASGANDLLEEHWASGEVKRAVIKLLKERVGLENARKNEEARLANLAQLKEPESTNSN